MSDQDIKGYGFGDVTSVMSVDDVQREAERSPSTRRRSVRSRRW